MLQATSCPTSTQLHDFLAGKLVEAEIDQVAGHLETCERCQRLLEELPEGDDYDLASLSDDGIVELLTADCRQMIDRVISGTRRRTYEQPPEEIREYVLGQQLGTGGMGVVFEATHKRLKRSVAIKLLRSRHEKALAVTRFQREMEAIGRVEHDNIVRALDAGEAEGFDFLVMERIEGMNFRDIVQARGKLPIADACEVVRQAACGLAHAHELNLIHRDVKPSNLMLSADGTVKLLDLGLALIAEQQIEEEQHDSSPSETRALHRDDTATGTVIGSAGYMSPEQALDSHKVDYRTDIYSLGRTLYFLLTGERPTADESALQRLHPELDPKLARLLAEMTSHAVEDRPQSASEIAERLQRFARGAALQRLTQETHGNAGQVPSASASTSQQPEPHTQYRIAALLAVGAVVLAIAAGVAWWSRERGVGSDAAEAVAGAGRDVLEATAEGDVAEDATTVPVVGDSVPTSTEIDEQGIRETAAVFETKQGLAISVTRQQDDKITTKVLTGDDAQQYVRDRPMLNLQLLYRNKPMFVMVTEVNTEAARIRVERAVGFFARAEVWEDLDADEPTFTFDGQNLNELMLREDDWCRRYHNELLGQAPAGGSVSRGTVQMQATGHRSMMISHASGYSIRIMEQMGTPSGEEGGILVDAGPEPLTNVRAANVTALRSDHPDAAKLYDQTLAFFGDMIAEMAQPISAAGTVPE